MYICSNCGATLTTQSNFCAHCGSRFVSQSAPVPVAVPVKKPVSKNIAGMVLGIAGMVLGIIGAIYAFLGIMIVNMERSYGASEASAMLSVFVIIFSTAGVVLSPIGLGLSCRHLNSGSQHKTATLGRVFGIVGLAISALALFVAIITLLSI